MPGTAPTLYTHCEEDGSINHLPREQQVSLGWGWGQADATVDRPLLEVRPRSACGSLAPRWGGARAGAAPTMVEKCVLCQLPAVMIRSHSLRGMLET